MAGDMGCRREVGSSGNVSCGDSMDILLLQNALLEETDTSRALKPRQIKELLFSNMCAID